MAEPTYSTQGLLGSEEVAVDSAGRIHVPSQWRIATGGLIALPWIPTKPDFINLFTPQSWANLTEQLVGMYNGAAESNLRRFIYARAFRVNLDTAGRIRLPMAMLAEVGISRRALMIGVGDRLELWAPERFQEELQKNAPSSEFFMSLRL